MQDGRSRLGSEKAWGLWPTCSVGRWNESLPFGDNADDGALKRMVDYDPQFDRGNLHVWYL